MYGARGSIYEGQLGCVCICVLRKRGGPMYRYEDSCLSLVFNNVSLNDHELNIILNGTLYIKTCRLKNIQG